MSDQNESKPGKNFRELISSLEWIFAMVILLVALTWLIFDPGFETVHVFLSGVSAFLSITLVLWYEAPKNDDTSRLNPSLGFRRIFGLISGLTFGSILGFIFGLTLGVSAGIIFGMLAGVIFGLNAGLKIGNTSSRGSNRGGWFGGDGRGRLGIGFGVGLISGLTFLLSAGSSLVLLMWLNMGLSEGVLFGLLGGLFGSFLAGLNNVEVKQQPMSRKRVIRKVLRSAAIISLTSTASLSLVNGPIFGLVPTLGLGLATGLATFVQYSTTRFCFYPRQPCLYPCGHFLNDALESVCDMLQSIGFVRPKILVSGFEIEEAQEQFKEKCKQFIASAKSSGTPSN